MSAPGTRTADDFLKAGRALADIHDIDDQEIVEALELFLASVRDEAELSGVGTQGMEQRLVRMLANRLRMLRDFRNHPEIDEQEVVAPLILAGAGRTGSTKLHKLLAATGDFKFMPFWQGYELGLRTGDRMEDPTPRIKDAEQHVEWFNRRAPDARLIHEYHAHEPEEETLLMEHGNLSVFMMAFYYVPSFIEWAGPRMGDTLSFMKQALKYLQWQFHDGDTRPWVLKCPLYCGAEPILADLFPDAYFVATHRDPTPVMSSGASLLNAYFRAYSDTERKPFIGTMITESNVATLQNFCANRRDFPGLKTLDVNYGELTRSAAGVIEKIYQHRNLAFTAATRESLSVWEAQNAQHKHGVHQHTLDEYGIDKDAMLARVCDYTRDFSTFFG